MLIRVESEVFSRCRDIAIMNKPKARGTTSSRAYSSCSRAAAPRSASADRRRGTLGSPTATNTVAPRRKTKSACCMIADE